MKRKLLSLLLLAAAMSNVKGQGNYVPSGGEAVSFSTLDLATPGGQTWSTDRSSVPGYFSVYGAVSITGASDASNINGYVKHYVTNANQGFSFPVGNGSDLRRLITSGTIPVSAQIATAWILGDPSSNLDPTSTGAAGGAHAVTSVGTGLTQVMTTGQWDWQDINASASGVTVTVSIPDLSAFGPASTLRLAGWNGSQWINLSSTQGTSAATGNTENSTVTGTMQSGITSISVAKTPLQVNLTPSVEIDNFNFSFNQSRDFTVNLFETLGTSTSGTVTFRISKLSGWDITVPGITLTAVDQAGVAGTSNVSGGTPNENDKWLFRQNTNFIFITLNPAYNISGFGVSTIGFTATRKSGTTTGTIQNISATVITGTGGDIDASDNTFLTQITATN